MQSVYLPCSVVCVGVLVFAAISHSAAFLLFFCSAAEGLHLQQLPDPASWISPGVGYSLSELLWLRGCWWPAVGGGIVPQGSAPSPLNPGMLVSGQNSVLLRQLVLMVLNRASLPLCLVKVD